MLKNVLKSFLLIMLFFAANFSKAQTSVNITWLADSAAGWQNCPPPVATDLLVYGDASGYNDVTDSIDLHIFWGDGTDTLYTADLVNGGTTDYFSVWGGLMHNYTMAGNFIVTVVATGVDGTDDTLTYGPITVYSGCVTVDGYCYDDNNSNCVFDAGDDTLSGIPIYILDGSGNFINYAYTDQNGYYTCGVPSGLTGLTIQASPYFYNSFLSATCPVSGTYNFNASGNMSFNFGFNCSSTGHDLVLYASSTRVDVPGGTNGWVYMYGGNYSCTPVNGVVTLTLPAEVSYTGTFYGPPPTSIAGNTLTWNHNFPAASYYWAGGNFYVGISISTATTATIFDTVCFNASIDPIAGDMNPADNSDVWCREIGGPYDPNNKEVSPAGIGAAGNVAPGTEFTYTINFQNTGTAPAINVFVMDTISSNLDLSTFKILGSSHSMNPIFNTANIVRFDFPNINLPDSNTNEPLSHGWVQYSVKAKSSLANGTEIKNTAHIYFDYNAAIVTNTTLNTIDIALGMQNVSTQSISNSMFPNPAVNNVTVKFDNRQTGVLSIVDMTGRVVKTVSLNKAEQVQIGIADLANGIYNIVMPGVELSQSRLQVVH